MPDDLKARLKTFVPPPAQAKIASLDRVPDAYDVPYKTWNASTRSYQEETEATPLTIHETERGAQRSIRLRLSSMAATTIHACRSKASGMTRMQVRSAPSPGRCLFKLGASP